MLSSAVALAVAVLMGILLVRPRLKHHSIPVLPTAPAGEADCMVVIPARNEEASIARAVKSFPPDTVIVVDDHSGDGTAEMARNAGAGVLTARDSGRSSACRTGAAVLTTRWILFTDADTWFEPQFLESAVAYAAQQNLVFLWIHLQPESRGCLLALREAYEFVGGHSGDDLKLEALAARHRMKTGTVRAPHLGHADTRKARAK